MIGQHEQLCMHPESVPPNMQSRTSTDANPPTGASTSSLRSDAMPAGGSGSCSVGSRLTARTVVLTRIELDILALLKRGLTNREIADSLQMNLSTVRWRLNQLFLKLHARNRIEALARARELLTLPSTETVVLSPYRTLDPLGKTQLAILSLLRQGMTNQEIANYLAMTIGTTRWHMNQIFGKLQVRNRVEAAMFLNSNDATQ